nr:MAG: RNA-dependent RNA polymerase [Mitoviridae sp.]
MKGRNLMSSSVSNQATIGCLVSRTVLGRSGQQFQREVERLTHHMGPEWVVTRFKTIWTAANHLRNGDRDAARALYQDAGIAYHKSDLTPKGPFRPAVRGYIHAKRPSVIKRYAAVLRFYTSIRLTELSKAQSDKAYNAIVSPGVSTSGSALATMHVWNTSNPMIKGLNAQRNGIWKPRTKDRYADGLRATSSYFSEVRVPKELRGVPYASMALSFVTNSYVPESLDRLTPIFEMREHLRYQDPNWDLKPVGRIVVLQEQGAKARVVAMPSAHLQLAFMPLHNRLADIARHAFPTQSVVTDQQKGVYGVLRHLSEGNEVHSVDLSSATDRFPRDYSIQLLKELGMRNYAEALEDVCSKTWDSPWGEVTYGAGQPMGLYGSFPLFHLSNLMVCQACEDRASQLADLAGEELSRFQNGSTFYVLGDDVVFSDHRVMRNYKRIMKDLDAPISEHKSFSGRLTEFAGFVVTESREGFVAFRPYKIPTGEVVTNPINFLDSLGSKVSNISRYWRRQWEFYQLTQSSRGLDLSPLVPEKLQAASNPFRGDAQTLVGMAQSLTTLMPDQLPDLSGSTKINTVPLFHERRVFDYYGFNPEELKAVESVRKDLPQVAVKNRLKDDPLISAVRAERRGESVIDTRLLTSPVRENLTSTPTSLPDRSGPSEDVKAMPIHPEKEQKEVGGNQPSLTAQSSAAEQELNESLARAAEQRLKESRARVQKMLGSYGQPATSQRKVDRSIHKDSPID